MKSKEKKNETEEKWQGFRGGVRVTLGSLKKDVFELVCGAPGRRKFSKGKLNAPVETIDNWEAGRLRTLLSLCEVDDTQTTFQVQIASGTRKTYFLFIESHFEHGVLVDGTPVKEIKRIVLPSCIMDGLKKVVELCPGGLETAM